jgi:hypothetical protein
MNMDPNELLIVQIAGGLVTLLTAALLIGKIIIPGVKRVKLWFENWDRFMIDWAGEEPRAGRDRVPGVMERLNAIDGELKNNGGSSVKDAVDRIEINVNEIKDRTDQIDLRLADGDKRFDQIDKRLRRLEDKP